MTEQTVTLAYNSRSFANKDGSPTSKEIIRMAFDTFKQRFDAGKLGDTCGHQIAADDGHPTLAIVITGGTVRSARSVADTFEKFINSNTSSLKLDPDTLAIL